MNNNSMEEIEKERLKKGNKFLVDMSFNLSNTRSENFTQKKMALSTYQKQK